VHVTTDLLPVGLRDLYEVHEWKHACAVLKGDYSSEWDDIIAVLSSFRLHRDDILTPGGGKSVISKGLDRAFTQRGWIEKSFRTMIVVDERKIESPTHKVDCFKNGVALEIEWSNKDPFFDRDLNNFRLLFDLRAISVGVIVTKADALRPVIEGLGQKVWDKFGTSTTWMRKLIPRIEGGSGGGCPILVFGITPKLYVEA
jgi:hypothetical protein